MTLWYVKWLSKIRLPHKVPNVFQAVDFVKKQKLSYILRGHLQSILDDFYQELAANDYHSSYFSRHPRAVCDRFCDEGGWFSCEGLYNEDKCKHFHTVNPYASYHDRLLFSTWNLDHRWEAILTVSTVVTFLRDHSSMYTQSTVSFTRDDLSWGNPYLLSQFVSWVYCCYCTALDNDRKLYM